MKGQGIEKAFLLFFAFSSAALAVDEKPWVGHYNDPHLIGYVVQLEADGTVKVVGTGTELYSGTYQLEKNKITLTYDSTFRQRQPQTAMELGFFDPAFKTLTITQALNGAPISRTLERSNDAN